MTRLKFLLDAILMTITVAILMTVIKNELVVEAVLVAIIVILAVAIILLLASLGAYLMKIAEGTTAFINAGDSVRAIWPNVVGYKISEKCDTEGRNWLIPTNAKEKKASEKERMDAFFRDALPGTVWFQKFLWKNGMRFISLIWPYVHRHTFDIRSRKRLLEGADVESGVSLKKRVVDSPAPEGTVVDSLLFLVPRPVYLDGVQLAGDNSRINLLLLPIYRQVIPILPVHHLKGDFFTQLDAALESGVVDFFATHCVGEKPLTYDLWLKLPKAGGNSPLEQHLRHINISKKYRDELREKELVDYVDEITQGALKEDMPGKVGEIAPSGIIPRFGFAMISFRIVDWEPHTDTKDLAKALLARETESHLAEGVRKKADGESYAIQKLSEGESSRFERLVKALTDFKVTPDVAAMVVQTQLRTENIRDGKVTTYVEGGASASVMVNASPHEEEETS